MRGDNENARQVTDKDRNLDRQQQDNLNLMKKYQIQNSIGSGNFSTVFKGLILPDLSPCAIKILKTHHNIAYRQAQLLKKFKHPNIISIIDFQQTPNESRLILEYMGINTLELIQSNTQGLKEEQVKCILFQAALALFCVHSHKIIHRDIKPENILIDKKYAIVKLIDFGLAIEAYQVSTDYVATRWYRAPENLLCTKQYTCAIDVFSLGCVIVELYLGYPLFPGKDNLEQIHKIFTMLGFPTPYSWPKGYQKLIELGIESSQNYTKPPGLKSVMSTCDPRLLQLLEKMLQINPKNRITCEEILRHDYFRNVKSIVPPSVFRRFEEDILTPKVLNFKGFQPARSSKNNSNQSTVRQSKINFHHVSAKPKHQEVAKPISIQKPPTCRQQKSSSVDSCNLAQSLSTPTLQYLTNLKSAPNNSELSRQVRKFSTPTLGSCVNSSEKVRINTDNFIMNNVKWKRQSEGVPARNNSLNQGGQNYVEMIPQDDEPQMTISTHIPDSSPPQSYVPKYPPEPKHKFEKISLQKPIEHRYYPAVQNVQFVQESTPVNHSHFSGKTLLSSNSSRQLKDQTTNTSIQISNQPVKPMYISLKQPYLAESHRSPLELAHNNFSAGRSFNDFQSLIDQKKAKQAGKKIRNLPASIPQFVHRENFGFQAQNLPRFDQIQTNYASPPHTTNKPVFLSPMPRNPATSPENIMNSGRQRRLHAVNSPAESFFMLQHRKY